MVYRLASILFLLGLFLLPIRGDAGGTGSWIGFGATLSATPGNPSGITSTGAVKMMGLGSTCTITPKYADRVLVSFSGAITNNTSTDGANAQIYYGTGSAPGNNGTLQGTAIGATPQYTASANGSYAPFSSTVILTGLTIGTAYWLDLGMVAITGGTATVASVGCTAVEL